MPVLKHVFKHFLFQKFFSPLQSFLFEEAKRNFAHCLFISTTFANILVVKIIFPLFLTSFPRTSGDKISSLNYSSTGTFKSNSNGLAPRFARRPPSPYLKKKFSKNLVFK